MGRAVGRRTMARSRWSSRSHRVGVLTLALAGTLLAPATAAAAPTPTPDPCEHSEATRQLCDSGNGAEQVWTEQANSGIGAWFSHNATVIVIALGVLAAIAIISVISKGLTQDKAKVEEDRRVREAEEQERQRREAEARAAEEARQRATEQERARAEAAQRVAAEAEATERDRAVRAEMDRLRQSGGGL